MPVRCGTQPDWLKYCQQEVCCTSYSRDAIDPASETGQPSLPFTQLITTLFRFVTTEAMGNLSVNQTRGHSVHKWLLVFPQWGSVEMTL